MALTQDDLFMKPVTFKWQVVDKKVEQHWNKQNRMFETFVLYVHTVPVGWKGPEILPEGELPWE